MTRVATCSHAYNYPPKQIYLLRANWISGYNRLHDRIYWEKEAA